MALGLRDDIRLLSVGKRRLEGHDRPEEVYVVQHGEVELVTVVAEDEVLAQAVVSRSAVRRRGRGCGVE